MATDQAIENPSTLVRRRRRDRHATDRNTRQELGRYFRIDGQSKWQASQRKVLLNKQSIKQSFPSIPLPQFSPPAYKNIDEIMNVFAVVCHPNHKRKCRYINKLDPQLNNNLFTEEEDRTIIDKYYIIGPKWSEIAKYLIGRSENMVKNRFYSYIKKTY